MDELLEALTTNTFYYSGWDNLCVSGCSGVVVNVYDSNDIGAGVFSEAVSLLVAIIEVVGGVIRVEAGVLVTVMEASVSSGV